MRRFRIWTGEAYAEQSAPVLLILTAANMMTFPHYTVYYALLGIGQQRGVAVLRIVEVAANLALSLILVRRFGIAGVALGTAIPHVLSMIVVLPLISAAKFGVSIGECLRTVVVGPMASVLPVIALGYMFHTTLPAATLVGLAAQVAALLVCFVPIALMIACTSAERKQLAARVRTLGFA